MINPGTYFGKLVEAGLTEIGDRKSPAIFLAFDVTHYAVGGDWRPIDPVTRDVVMYLTEKAEPHTMRKLMALGFNGDFNAPAFAPRLSEGVQLMCEHRPRDGKTYEEWNFAEFASGERERQKVGGDVARTFAAKFRTYAQANARPSAPPPPAAKPPPAAAAPASQPAAQSAPSAGSSSYGEPPF